MVALNLIPRPGLATQLIALICYLVALLFSRGPAVVGNRWSRVVSQSDASHPLSNIEFCEFEECLEGLASI